jgi:HD-GYP domain-containing protein (c-di-GMP phosphodiesterase class II)
MCAAGADISTLAEVESAADAFSGPIAPPDFDRLAAAWRTFGIWLTLWDKDRGLVRQDALGPRFWTVCWRTSSSFQSLISERVAEILSSCDARGQEGDNAPAILLCTDVPGFCDGGLALIPIRRRRRVIGACVGALAYSALLDEEALYRFCTLHRLDGSAIRNMLPPAEAFVGTGDARLRAFAALAADFVEGRLSCGRADEEIESLTRNLSTTYEELSLVYRVSAQLQIAQEPAAMLRNVSRETLNVSRVAGLAFVLPDFRDQRLGFDGAAASLDTVRKDEGSNQQPAPAATSRLVRIGCDGLSDAWLVRLAEVLKQGAGEREHILVNNIPADGSLGWARPWLRQCVAFPLRGSKREMGLMLGLNTVDQGDFTSIDVQLLRAVGSRVAAFLENQRLYDDLVELLMGLLHALVKSIDAKDPYTCGHSERVAFLSRRIAETAGLSEVAAQRVYLAGLLHDVGKIGIADAVLCKQGRLTNEEFAEIQKHPEIGARILSNISQVQDLLPGVLHHHERMDGRGYPDRLAGAQIPRLARILCVADCLDAMTTTRTYRSFLTPALALAEIRRCAGTQFDPHLSETLLSMDVSRLLHEAHEFAGSRLPSLRDGADGSGEACDFSSRPIFNREMFGLQVSTW